MKHAPSMLMNRTQIEAVVRGAGPSAWSQYQQALREIAVRDRRLRGYSRDREELQLKMARLLDEMQELDEVEAEVTRERAEFIRMAEHLDQFVDHEEDRNTLDHNAEMQKLKQQVRVHKVAFENGIPLQTMGHYIALGGLISGSKELT